MSKFDNLVSFSKYSCKWDFALLIVTYGKDLRKLRKEEASKLSLFYKKKKKKSTFHGSDLKIYIGRAQKFKKKIRITVSEVWIIINKYAYPPNYIHVR